MHDLGVILAHEMTVFSLAPSIIARMVWNFDEECI